jgi:hypothetical protein
MARIDYSPELGNHLAYSMFLNSDTSSIARFGYLANYASHTSYLKIMKGTIPTDFTGLTTSSSRSEDVLLSWERNIILSTSSITSTSPTAIITTPYANATATGTATWFWVFSAVHSNIMNQFFGNVTELGFGGDLEISSTSIVSGQPYRVNNLRLYFPASWTY